MGGFEILGGGVRDALTSPEGAGVLVWVLAMTFAWSGGAKLRRPLKAALALVDFGIARRALPTYGRALGIAELCLAGLLVATFAVAGALPAVAAAAAAAFLLFAAAIGRSLRRGDRFACFCFGGESVLSGTTLARSLGLVAVAGWLVASEVAGQGARAVMLEGLVAVCALAVVVLGASIPRLRRMNADPFGLDDELWSVRA